MSENLTTEQALKQKNKAIDLKHRKTINELLFEIDELKNQLTRWADDNKQLRSDNLELMETVKTINAVLRGIMFQKCVQCKTSWKSAEIKKMMKSKIVDCPGCDLYIQVK